MSIQINYKPTYLNKKLINFVLFVDENFNITGLKKLISLRLSRHKFIIDCISFLEAFFTFFDFLN